MEQPSPSAVPAWELRDRLRKARDHAGLSQEELEARMGISRASISNYERGIHVPSRPVLLAWAVACGVDLEWLAGTGPTMRGTRKRRPPPRKTAALIPMIPVASLSFAALGAAYLTAQGPF